MIFHIIGWFSAWGLGTLFLSADVLEDSKIADEAPFKEVIPYLVVSGVVCAFVVGVLLAVFYG